MKDIKRAGEINTSSERWNRRRKEEKNVKNSKIRKYISVSVKTRIGYNKDKIEEWIPFLLAQDIDALTFACRTGKKCLSCQQDGVCV